VHPIIAHAFSYEKHNILDFKEVIMRQSNMVKWIAAGMLMMVFFAACKSGGGNSASNPPASGSTTVSGTAATGKAIANTTVFLRDESGHTATSSTDANGKYSVNMSGFSTPVLLKITTTNGDLYGIATQSGTANLHQFTDLIIRNWYTVQGFSIETEFVKAGSISVPSKAEIDTIESVVRQMIGSWLSTMGVDPTAFSLITTSFNADGSGFDTVLDLLKVTISSTSISIMATDPNTGLAAETVAALPAGADLSTNPLQSAIDGVNQTLTAWKNAINAKGASTPVTDLMPFYASNFLNDGLDASTDIADTLSANNFPGTISAIGVSKIVSYDGINKTITVECEATSSNWGTGSFEESFIYDAVQTKWLFYGNQKTVYLQLRPGVQKTISTSGTTITNILSVNAENTAGAISQIAVSGPGLLTNPTILSKSSNGSTDNFYIPNNGPLSSPVTVGSVYTFYVTRSDATVIAYAEMIKATTSETLNISGPAGHTIADAHIGSSISVNWTLPTSFHVNYITLVGWVNDSNGGFQQPPYINPDIAATSGSITLPQPTNGGTVTNAGIAIFITGTKGEQSVVNYIFE